MICSIFGILSVVFFYISQKDRNFLSFCILFLLVAFYFIFFGDEKIFSLVWFAFSAGLTQIFITFLKFKNFLK